MISFVGTLVVYIGQLFNPGFASDWFSKALICFIFAGLVGRIALIGVTGSTLINIVINVVQIVSLTFLDLLMIVYRIGHPNVNYEHSNALSVVIPHDLTGLIYQGRSPFFCWWGLSRQRRWQERRLILVEIFLKA